MGNPAAINRNFAETHRSPPNWGVPRLYHTFFLIYHLPGDSGVYELRAERFRLAHLVDSADGVLPDLSLYLRLLYPIAAVTEYIFSYPSDLRMVRTFRVGVEE